MSVTREGKATVERGQEARGLAVLLSCQDMRQVFDDWPPHMNLAVCLREDGNCSMLVFRDEEGSRILPRLRRTLGLSMSEITVFPKTDGFPTRKLLFSEEKQLLSLVRNTPEIVEEAADYSINYRYAVDEGMDPVMFIHRVRSKGTARRRAQIVEHSYRAEETARPSAKPVLADTLKKSDQPNSTSDLPKFLQKDIAVTIGTTSTPVRHRRTSRICRINDTDQGWCRIDLPGSAGGQLVLNSLGCIFLRDDERVLAIQKERGRSEPRDMPEEILVYVGDRPSRIRDALARNVGLAQVTYEHGLLFIDLKHGSETRVDTDQSSSLKRPKLPYLRYLISAGMVMAGLLFFFQSFFQSNSPDVTDQTINWSQFQLESSNTNNSLNFDGSSQGTWPFES